MGKQLTAHFLFVLAVLPPVGVMLGVVVLQADRDRACI